MLVALDSNILLRLLKRSGPVCKEIRQAMKLLGQQGAVFCYFPQNAAEFWNVCTRPATARGGYGFTVAQTTRRLKLIEKHFQLLPDDMGVYTHWRQMVESLNILGVQVHDAKIAAAMKEHGVKTLLTINATDFKRFNHMTAVSPEEVITTFSVP